MVRARGPNKKEKGFQLARKSDIDAKSTFYTHGWWHALFSRLRKKKSYFMVFLTAVLIASVGLNLYDNLHVKPVMQTRMDYMSSEAFQSWLDEFARIGDILEIAETKGDAKRVFNLTRTAVGFASILEWQIEIVRPLDFGEHLYLRIAGASSMLHRGLSVITRHSSVQANLSVWDVQKIENLTTTIESLVDFVGTVRDGVCPVRQLEEKGVLNQVKNYLLQIRTTSEEIWEMYSIF